MNQRTHPVRGELLLQLAKAKGLSLAALAEAAEVHPKTLKRMSAGGESFLENISNVARELGVECDVLRADVEPAIQKKTAHFEMTITVTGTADSEYQLGSLLTLTPNIISKLAEAGIKISGAESKLDMREAAGDDTKRTIVLLYGVFTNANPFWCFVAVKPSQFKLFLGVQKSGALDLHNFTPYGEVIVSGDGKEVPQDVIQKLADMYDTTPQIFTDLVPPE
jgi:transcriptional regulator with XRE-family HTH domain